MIREYPDVRQTDSFDCGMAGIAGVFRYLGVPLRADSGLATEADGLHPSTIEAIIRRAGLKVQSGTMHVQDLKHHTRLLRPVLCPIDVYGGHWVTVLGVTRARVTFHCPVRGRLWDTHESWCSVWHDATRAGHPFDFWGIAVCPSL